LLTEVIELASLDYSTTSTYLLDNSLSSLALGKHAGSDLVVTELLEELGSHVGLNTLVFSHRQTLLTVALVQLVCQSPVFHAFEVCFIL
jgi:hypothetical protein